MSSHPTLQTERLQELLDEIDSLRVGAQWELPLDFVLGVLELPREDYYRVMYALHGDGAPIDMTLESFGPDTTEQLLLYLNHHGHGDATRAFESAGLFFSDHRLLDWLEFFQSVSLARMQGQSVDKNLLQDAVDGCQRFSDAADFYLHCKYERDDFMHFAVPLFLEKNRIENHHGSRAILEDFLQEQFRLGWIKWDAMCATQFDRLLEHAIQWSFVSRDDVDRDEELLAITPEVQSALQELGFVRWPSRAKLKSRYRSLLKKYHPDVNTQGGERTRAIVAAYTFLIGRNAA